MSLGAEFFRQSKKPWKLARFDFSFWFSPFEIIRGKISPYFVWHEEDLAVLGTVTKRLIFTLKANRQISRQFFFSNKASLLTYSRAINCGNWLMVFTLFGHARISGVRFTTTYHDPSMRSPGVPIVSPIRGSVPLATLVNSQGARLVNYLFTVF